MSLAQADRSIDEVREAFAELGQKIGVFVPTRTGLEKGIMDAPKALREFLAEQRIHDFESCPKGAKIEVPAILVTSTHLQPTTISFYRPNTKDGDPRFWIYRLRKYATPGNVLALLASSGRLYVVNCSEPYLFATLRAPATVLGGLMQDLRLASAPFGEISVLNLRDRGVEQPIETSGLERLQKRSFGGQDVATRPGVEDDAWWPRGEMLPGVDKVITDFSESPCPLGGLRLVFLLGGAGNGKSYAARELGARIGIAGGPDGQLARRIYKSEWKGVSTILLNDATIARRADYGKYQPVALAHDIQRWWDDSKNGPVAVFCCVNRGIVIDEIRALASAVFADESLDSLPSEVLKWLASHHSPISKILTGGEGGDSARLDIAEGYAEKSFFVQGRYLEISALSVDTCSLVDRDASYGESRGAKLFGQVLARCKDEALGRPGLCPIRANMEQLTQSDSVESWEYLVRSAEIASGRLFSYRDIWGLAALSVLGPRYSGAGKHDAMLSHVENLISAHENAGTSLDRLLPILDLARFRLPNSIFASPVPEGARLEPVFPPRTPAHKGFGFIDPSSWVTKDAPFIEEAMELVSVGELPSEKLKKSGFLPNGIGQFDSALENAVISYVTDDVCDEKTRRRLMFWLGGYFARLVGFARRSLGNHDAIQLWKECQAACSSGPVALPVQLYNAVRALLFPPQSNSDLGEHNLLIPAFATRARPLREITGDSPSTLVQAYRTNSVGLQCRASGERVVVECIQIGTNVVMGQLLLDLPLVREALACFDGKSGQTETSFFVEPRIERCRASTISKILPPEQILLAVTPGKKWEMHQ